MALHNSEQEHTPLMKQYWELKAKAADALLLFRMGDFYELFGDDAITASQILAITLTSRDKNKANPVPMCGVPHHSVQSYIQKLLKAGKKVAIGEQMEDPATAKGIVRRDITRIFSPAIQFDLEGAEAAYLATAIAAPNGQWVLACLDSSTGEALISAPMQITVFCEDLARLPIRHFLRMGSELPEEALRLFNDLGDRILLEDLPFNYLSKSQALDCLKRVYGVQNLDAFIQDSHAGHALGILVTYAARSQFQDTLAHLQIPESIHKPRSMALGPHAAEHLDLFPESSPKGENHPNLFQLINRTRSAPGARQLRRWLAEPLKAPSDILRRQKSVRELAGSASRLENISQELAQIYDLERISGRINTRLANPRDTLALGRSLATLPRLIDLLASFKEQDVSNLRSVMGTCSECLAPLTERILSTQLDDAPLVYKDGGIFCKGTTPELDRLLTLTEDGQRFLIELETKEREATGIPSLKIRYNRVFGYYIEVTQAHLKNVPAHYQRKQTTVGAERFFTEELKKFEEEIITASAKQKALEQRLFEELVSEIQSLTPYIMEAARALAELDALAALARLADQPGWIFPEVDDSLDLDIEAGRHPLVDVLGNFVPNDAKLSPETRLTLLITGPNMGGKSTVMRQVALIVILGQMGAPVPTARARWGAVSSLHTRIGAHDAIARGQSTFMVEMSELAHILHFADERSLIILDEIGRGTSTYDGISVAWATLEWICSRIKARTLFATHYHELTRLTGTLPRLANAHMAVDASRGSRGKSASESGDGGLRFLYQLREGPTNDSFGVHVAKIAGIPQPVVERAWQVLEELEAGSSPLRNASGDLLSEPDSTQLSFLDMVDDPKRAAPPAAFFAHPSSSQASVPHIHLVQPEPDPRLKALADRIADADLNQMTPLRALQFLAELQQDVKG